MKAVEPARAAPSPTCLVRSQSQTPAAIRKRDTHASVSSTFAWREVNSTKLDATREQLEVPKTLAVVVWPIRDNNTAMQKQQASRDFVPQKEQVPKALTDIVWPLRRKGYQLYVPCNFGKSLSILFLDLPLSCFAPRMSTLSLY